MKDIYNYPYFPPKKKFQENIMYICKNFTSPKLMMESKVTHYRTDGNQPNWFVAYTVPRCEKKVALNLMLSGIEYFLPLYKEVRQWADRKKKIEVPVFPSYIFVKVSDKDIYKAINTTGIVKFVEFGGKHAKIDSQTIEHIRTVTDKNLLELNFHEIPVSGKKYIIANGPLKGAEGVFIRQKGKSHFYMEIKELGKYIIIPGSYLK